RCKIAGALGAFTGGVSVVGRGSDFRKEEECFRVERARLESFDGGGPCLGEVSAAEQFASGIKVAESGAGGDCCGAASLYRCAFDSGLVVGLNTFRGNLSGAGPGPVLTNMVAGGLT